MYAMRNRKSGECIIIPNGWIAALLSEAANVKTRLVRCMYSMIELKALQERSGIVFESVLCSYQEEEKKCHAYGCIFFAWQGVKECYCTASLGKRQRDSIEVQPSTSKMLVSIHNIHKKKFTEPHPCNQR